MFTGKKIASVRDMISRRQLTDFIKVVYFCELFLAFV